MEHTPPSATLTLRHRWQQVLEFTGLRDFIQDARHLQLLFLNSFLAYGLLELGWQAEWLGFALIFAGALGTQYFFVRVKGLPLHSLKSAWISSLSLCLMLKANSPWVLLLAAVLSIGGKLLIRWKGKQIWNPTNFGIILTILLTREAWISPGQWGSSATLFFFIAGAGLCVLLTARRLETGLVFLAVFSGMEFLRLVVHLGWPVDYWQHLFTSGNLLVFSFFMITDPMASPNARIARILWAALTALLAWYLAVWHFVNGAPLWALFCTSPLVPVLDHIWKHEIFTWKKP